MICSNLVNDLGHQLQVSEVASYADSPTLSTMLAARCDPNPPLSGFGFSPLHGAVLFSRRNRRAVQIGNQEWWSGTPFYVENIT